MAVSTNGILEVVFVPEWAACTLVVDGGMWPSAVTSITVTRTMPGFASITVRGLERREVIDGSWIGSDPEISLDSSVTYEVVGYSAAGLEVGRASVTVETTGAAWGLWLTVAGKPNLTTRAVYHDQGAVTSTTQGGVYPVAGGGSVAQSIAQYSGTDGDATSVTIRADSDAEIARVRAVLDNHRIVLLRTGLPELLDSGWYFVDRVTSSWIEQTAEIRVKTFTLSLIRTAMPVGKGTGTAGVTWISVAAKHPTWAAVKTAVASWFELMKGA